MRKPKAKTIVFTVVVLAIGYLAGRGCHSNKQEEAKESLPAAMAEPTIWTCSMHPQVRLPEAGKCPICFMDLIPADSGDEEELGPRVLQMTESAMALAEIETATVERRTVEHEVSMVGKIAFDETRLAYITSWVSGRLDRLFVDYTGVTVRENDHLVEIYSPTLYAAQQELLQAISTAKRLEESSLDILRSTSNQTVISSREKLRLYGLSDLQIQEVVERGVPKEHVTIHAPIGGVVVHKNALEGMYVDEGTRIYTIADLTKVWVLLDAYESDLAWLRYGQDVEFRVEAYPGEIFHGRVAFIDPLLDDRTRTVKVRLNVENDDLRLKPDMFVSATAHAVLTSHGKVVDENLAGKWMCPMHPEVIAESKEECTECGMDLVVAADLGFVTEPQKGESLVIPHTAPLVTGKRAVVYVRLPSLEKPTFEGREVALGPRAGDWYVIHDGLSEGEEVVVKGNFKIDSELQIRARPSMMSPAGGGPPPGHDHGAQAPRGEHAIEAPDQFMRQLGDVVDEYLRLQRSLANDKDDQELAQGLVSSVEKVDMGLLEGEAHVAWMKHLKKLSEAGKQLVSADSMDQRRSELLPMTNALIQALKTFSYRREAGQVNVFHCPMALDGEGADWIQQGDETANPYFGSEMLRCGSQTETLEQKG